MPAPAVTVYGCDPDEAGSVRELAPRLGIEATTTHSPVSDATVALATGTRCISVGHKTRIRQSTLRALSRVGVEYISTRSIGYDHIDVRYAAGVGITVENVAYSPDSVADYTLMLILMALRDAPSMLRRVDAHDYRLSAVRGRELRDLTVGVVGTGRIGAAVIARLRAFGCHVLAHDIRPKAAADHVPLERLLHRSDIVTLHTPLNAATHHLLDRRRIDQLKPGAYVVNTARGALIDTDALIDALRDGRLGGAALDVLEGEEGLFYADPGHAAVEGTPLGRLRALPNVIISPHTAYYTDRALRDTVENSLLNCLRFENGARHV